MYFQDFPQTPFDFPIKADGENQFVVVRDITENVRFKKEFLDGVRIYETYKIKDGETIDLIAEKVYGTPHYHWILMLANERYDYIEDFPLTSAQLEVAINAKYGKRKNDVKIYTDVNGNVTTPTVSIKIDLTIATNLGDTTFDEIVKNLANGQRLVMRKKTVIGYYTGYINQIVDQRLLVSMTVGDFKVGDKIEVYRYGDDADGNLVETFIGYAKVLAFDVPEQIVPVTNHTYELAQNEKKRFIKIVPKQYVDQMMNELGNLL